MDTTLSDCYKLNIGATLLLEEGKRGIGVVVRSIDGIVVVANC